ncbi:pyridoxal-phosphate dependent enzyme [Halalkalicoccus jeotgali]|uniref:Threonine synthase n=1 Tax=Halalkalicoccus jeotgali (strain DSM 18796 / CECT 7217 / JCM 14584 / KCTC 4019 / B3) TaxID=795797 RepID=D8J5B6_HALJB|nr:pyridoxal-phosphate dependent enzyme [Halalkalicoccus jeotgali]ADJ13697.1 threonine synthase [Halalkalicoccus jeotgali B3]ELY34256.1 threonine synthase [Halalkalicoccus jeotgali B3]
MASDLFCPACERTYAAGVDEPWRCSCGGPLELADRPLPEGPPPAFSELDTRRGLWAFSEFMPISREITLGEGFTPLVSAPEWNAAFKLEYVFPTGSFKDRGATTLLSRAAELGVERVLEDSSGNAGAAVATYAARAGIDAEIYVPASVKASKVAAIERAGGKVIRVEGDREAVTEACIDAVEGTETRSAGTERGRSPRQAGGGWYASHAWNPAFFAGTQTAAFEIAAQRDWQVPDAVVLPLGHGTLFLGVYRGFRALFEADWIDSMPRLLGAQAVGYAPIADTIHGTIRGENGLADGIRIREPVRETEIREAIAETDGDAIAIGETQTERELDRLHRAGFYTEPTCAVAPAALREYRARGVLDDGDDVVVPLTGSGLKAVWS